MGQNAHLSDLADHQGDHYADTSTSKSHYIMFESATKVSKYHFARIVLLLNCTFLCSVVAGSPTSSYIRRTQPMNHHEFTFTEQFINCLLI